MLMFLQFQLLLMGVSVGLLWAQQSSVAAVVYTRNDGTRHPCPNRIALVSLLAVTAVSLPIRTR